MKENPIITCVLVSDFNYSLPEELIAQEPLADRAASRLLHLNRSTTELHDRQFRDFPELLKPDDLVVFNNTRVFPARLYGRRSGANAQPLSPRIQRRATFCAGPSKFCLTRQLSAEPNEWECLVRPGRKIGVGEQLFFGEASGVGRAELQAEVIARGSFGERRIRFLPVPDFFAAVERIGHVPLPPYIDREDQPADRERYQTIYAREKGSVAAPTAGLHFTPEILARIKERGIETAEVTLHVGLGTFQPVREERVEDHKLHRESLLHFRRSRGSDQSRAGRRTAHRRRRHHHGQDARIFRRSNRLTGRPQAGSGEADIFIYPGYEFRVVGALLTNFHLPQSTLLMLVCAFAGKEECSTPTAMLCASATGFIPTAIACSWSRRFRLDSAGASTAPRGETQLRAKVMLHPRLGSLTFRAFQTAIYWPCRE